MAHEELLEDVAFYNHIYQLGADQKIISTHVNG